MVEISAPRPRSTRAVLFTSSPVRSPVSSLVPRASAASMRALWEMLLSPGGRTAPRTFTRRVSGATRRRGAARRRAPRRRPLPAPAQAPERLFQGAQRREQFVTVHEKYFRPQGRLGGGEARGVARARAEGR